MDLQAALAKTDYDPRGVDAMLFPHGGECAAAFGAYVAERQPRTTRVPLQSRQQFANNRKVPPPPFLDRTWIFTFDATREQPVPQPA